MAGSGLGPELGLRLEPGTPYLLVSSAPGESLERLLADSQLAAAAREALALTVARDVAAALAALHGSGAAHGDVKPANIIVSSDAGQARLVDFGLSGAAHQVEVRGGTARYLAPEVFGAGDGDARARDLWALGATLLEILEPAAAQVVVSEFEFRAAGALGPVVRGLLSRAPGARPSAAWVFRRALSGSAAEAPSAQRERRRECVRRCYLSTRRAEIFSAARSKGARLELSEPALTWLTESRALAEGILKLRGRPLDDVLLPPVSALDPLARSRFLVALVGPAAASWPALRELSEAQLLTRLLELAEDREPESFTLAAIRARRAAARAHRRGPQRGRRRAGPARARARSELARAR
ncbi:MAG: protein kinase [Gammaproteobacteria bacterium]